MTQGDAKKAAARPAVDRVLDRIEVDENGCWIWPGATAGPETHRYGMIQTGSRTDGTRRTVGTHVVTYEAFIGPVPDGLELDHVVCRTPLCCNPWHLEAVTHKVNMERAVWPPEEIARRSAWAHNVLQPALARKRAM